MTLSSYLRLALFMSSRASSLTCPSSPACLRSQASPPGSKVCSASTGRRAGALTSSPSRSGRRWNRPLTQPRGPRPPRPSASWSAPASGCTLSGCPGSWSRPWCVSAPGTYTGRRDGATLLIQWPTSTCKTAPPCGGSTGTQTPAPGVWRTPAASWWTIATSWTRHLRTVLFTCRIRSSRRRSRCWDWCPNFRRTASCEKGARIHPQMCYIALDIINILTYGLYFCFICFQYLTCFIKKEKKKPASGAPFDRLILLILFLN